VGTLIYMPLCSLDGYVEDAGGRFDWAAPDEEVHAFVNDRMRGASLHLYGRRMYETMKFWEATLPANEPAPIRDFAAIWQAAEKIVYSRTLKEVASRRTRLEREFAPDVVRRLVAEAPGDVGIGGAELAGRALAAGLVNELHLYLAPVVVGGGKRVLPEGVRVELRLLEERRFTGGMVFVRYAVEPPLT
jgi:dihydrofolate reductase